MKSMADSVALPPLPKSPYEVELVGAVLEMVIDMARNVSANSSTGNDDFKQRSRDSAKVMKIPASGQLVTCYSRTNAIPFSS